MTDDGTSTFRLSAPRLQRSHILFVITGPRDGQLGDFQKWLKGTYCEAVSFDHRVLRSRFFAQHSIDITGGQWRHFRSPYLAVHELSLDGAEEAMTLVEMINQLHQSHAAPATWLYSPCCERVGEDAQLAQPMVVVAFATGLPGRQDEFREWYTTRHIRHALNIPCFANGQCFLRTQCQRPGSMKAEFDLIALYEIDDGPEAILESMDRLPKGLLAFPSLDTGRFEESVYQPLAA